MGIGPTVFVGRGACFYTALSLVARVGFHFEVEPCKLNKFSGRLLRWKKKDYTYPQGLRRPSTETPRNLLNEQKAFQLKRSHNGTCPGSVSHVVTELLTTQQQWKAA
jgi:hypothetical protein